MSSILLADGARVSARDSILSYPDVHFRVIMPEFPEFQTIISVQPMDPVLVIKQKVLNIVNKELKDPLNYGLYSPPSNSRAGKFLDDERPIQDYPMSGSIGLLEFKCKKRIHKTDTNPVKLKKLHTPSEMKAFLEFVRRSDIDQITKYTNKGFDPNFNSVTKGETPMTVAATLNKPRAVMMALIGGGAFIDYRNKDGQTPLHVAAENGMKDAIRVLLDLGSAANYKDADGLTPLYYSAMYNTPPQCLQMLLHERADIGIRDKNGMMEIHQTCANGHSQHLEHLLFYGADVNETVLKTNDTPLHVCANVNEERCAKILLFRGADKTLTNSANQNPAQLASARGNEDLAKIIRDYRDEDVALYDAVPEYNDKRRGTISAATIRNLQKSRSNPQLFTLFLQSGSGMSNTVSPAMGHQYQQHGLLPNGVTSSSGHHSTTAIRDVFGSNADATLRNKEKSIETTAGNGSIRNARIVEIRRNVDGFGFTLRGPVNKQGEHFTPTQDVPARQYVESVEPGSSSDKAGLQPGDFILEINGQNVTLSSHAECVELSRKSTEKLTMKVVMVRPTHQTLTYPETKKDDTTSMNKSRSPSLSTLTSSQTGVTVNGLEALEKLDADLEFFDKEESNVVVDTSPSFEPPHEFSTASVSEDSAVFSSHVDRRVEEENSVTVPQPPPPAGFEEVYQNADEVTSTAYNGHVGILLPEPEPDYNTTSETTDVVEEDLMSGGISRKNGNDTSEKMATGGRTKDENVVLKREVVGSSVVFVSQNRTTSTSTNSTKLAPAPSPPQVPTSHAPLQSTYNKVSSTPPPAKTTTSTVYSSKVASSQLPPKIAVAPAPQKSKSAPAPPVAASSKASAPPVPTTVTVSSKTSAPSPPVVFGVMKASTKVVEKQSQISTSSDAQAVTATTTTTVVATKTNLSSVPPPPPPPPPPPAPPLPPLDSILPTGTIKRIPESSLSKASVPSHVQKQLEETKKREEGHAVLMAAVMERKKLLDSTDSDQLAENINSKVDRTQKLPQTTIYRSDKKDLKSPVGSEPTSPREQGNSSTLLRENKLRSPSVVDYESPGFRDAAEKARQDYLIKTLERTPKVTEEIDLAPRNTQVADVGAGLELKPAEVVKFPSVESNKGFTTIERTRNKLPPSPNAPSETPAMADIAQIIAQKALEKKQIYEEINDATLTGRSRKKQIYIGVTSPSAVQPDKEDMGSAVNSRKTMFEFTAPPPPKDSKTLPKSPISNAYTVALGKTTTSSSGNNTINRYSASAAENTGTAQLTWKHGNTNKEVPKSPANQVYNTNTRPSTSKSVDYNSMKIGIKSTEHNNGLKIGTKSVDHSGTKTATESMGYNGTKTIITKSTEFNGIKDKTTSSASTTVVVVPSSSTTSNKSMNSPRNTAAATTMVTSSKAAAVPDVVIPPPSEFANAADSTDAGFVPDTYATATLRKVQPAATQKHSMVFRAKSTSLETSPLTPTTFRDKDIQTWTVGDIGEWLESIDYDEYREGFVAQNLTGQRLSRMKQEDLQSLGVANPLHRVKMEREIRKFTVKK